MAGQLGAEILTTRTRDLLRYREGQFSAGQEMAGQHVVAQMDGGRIRIRTRIETTKRKGVKHRRKIRVEWREPKLLILYLSDRKGRMLKGTRPWIDGTMNGPDHLMELLAFHLHRLGAARAKAVSFVADGAPWIWNRLDWVIARAGLDSKRTERILDCCHAVHHVSLALQALGLAEPERTATYRTLRHQLRAGRSREVVAKLRAMAQAQPYRERAVAPRHRHRPQQCYVPQRDRRRPRTVSRALLAGLTVTADGKACPGSLDRAWVMEETAAPSSRSATSAPKSRAASRWRCLCRRPQTRPPPHGAPLPRGSGASFVLDRAHPVWTLDTGSASGSLAMAWAMLKLGVEHILTGADHLVFFFGLILVGRRLRSLIGVVSAFTVAHSITLALAALSIFAPSPRLVEPAIALSIAYVGVENLFVHDASKRWRITFPFGLIHGFGFAGALREIALPRAQVPVPWSRSTWASRSASSPSSPWRCHSC